MRDLRERLIPIPRRLLPKSEYSACQEVLSESFTHHARQRSIAVPIRSGSTVQFDRGHLCYSRPLYIPHSDVITAGLPPKRSSGLMMWCMLSRYRTDILNMLNPSSQKSKSTFRQRRDYHERMEAARHLSKYLFPREYGLATAFASVRAHKYLDFADREDEIKVRVEYLRLYPNLFRCCVKKAHKSKTPKRVKSTLDLLERVIYRHGNCSYNALRDITCPSKLKRPEREAALDASIILVCLSRARSNVDVCN
jgi:hypothetical protein